VSGRAGSRARKSLPNGFGFQSWGRGELVGDEGGGGGVGSVQPVTTIPGVEVRVRDLGEILHQRQ
jgi:hypothetical protein